MIKIKTLIQIVIFIATIFFISNYESFSNESLYKDSSKSSKQAVSSESSVVDMRVTPLVGIGPVEFGMTKEDVIERLGEPDAIQDKGLSLLYLSKGFSILVHPQLGVRNFNCFTRIAIPPNLQHRAKNFEGATQEGIAMGSTEAQIMAAYGKPSTRKVQGRQTNLTYDNLRLYFTLFSDRLVQFIMMAPVTRPRKH